MAHLASPCFHSCSSVTGRLANSFLFSCGCLCRCRLGGFLGSLFALLWHNAINEVDICGLGTDQCIRATIEDFGCMMQGNKIRFIENASRGFLEDRVQFAIGEIKSRGVEVVTV